MRTTQAKLNLLGSTCERLRVLQTLCEPPEQRSRPGSDQKVSWECSEQCTSPLCAHYSLCECQFYLICTFECSCSAKRENSPGAPECSGSRGGGSQCSWSPECSGVLRSAPEPSAPVLLVLRSAPKRSRLREQPPFLSTSARRSTNPIC
jgi:hypothetical protein